MTDLLEKKWAQANPKHRNWGNILFMDGHVEKF